MRPFKTVSLRENVLRRNVVREIDINSFMFYTHLYFERRLFHMFSTYTYSHTRNKESCSTASLKSIFDVSESEAF